MKFGLCAWSFTGPHRKAGCQIDPHEPEGLAGMAAASGLAIETAACSAYELQQFAVSVIHLKKTGALAAP